MPLYEFECKCGAIFEKFLKLELFEKEIKCTNCGGLAQLNIKPVKSKVFRKQHLDGVCTDNINYKPTVVGSKQEVVDAMNRFNDSEIASKQGKVVIAE